MNAGGAAMQFHEDLNPRLHVLGTRRLPRANPTISSKSRKHLPQGDASL